MKKTTVIFDLGKVLVEYDWQSYLETFSFDDEVFHIISKAMFLNEDWETGDRGATSEEWLSLFIENAPSYETEIRKVYRDLGECAYLFPYTLELVEYFEEKGYRIFFLSNYSEYLYEKTKEKLCFLDAFDGGVFSFHEKCIKPDKSIYMRLLERYNICPEEAIFFDDREENIRAAEEVGIHGILFTQETADKILKGELAEVK